MHIGCVIICKKKKKIQQQQNQNPIQKKKTQNTLSIDICIRTR